MGLRIPTSGLEPELLAPAPRRIRLRWTRWLLSLKILLIGPPILALTVPTAQSIWELLLTIVGTPVTVRVIDRGLDGRGYRVVVAWPRSDWDGHAHEATQELRPSSSDYFGLTRGRTLPALRLGRGGLQLLAVQTSGRALDLVDRAGAVALFLAFAAGGLAFIVGREGRERWLAKWGRPVRGVVRARSKSDTRRPECTVTYEYWELGRPGLGAAFRGRRVVTAEQYEKIEVGQGVSVVHSLWNPRRHVAYSLLPRR
jgi:hypothetical protein